MDDEEELEEECEEQEEEQNELHFCSYLVNVFLREVWQNR